jgi:hypothetical protein
MLTPRAFPVEPESVPFKDLVPAVLRAKEGRQTRFDSLDAKDAPEQPIKKNT